MAFTTQNPIEEVYGKYTFNYVNVTYVNQTNEGRLKTVTPFSFENCTEELFGFDDITEFYTTGIQNYQCLSQGQNITEMPLIGDYYSKTFTYFQLIFERCQNSSK